VISRTVFTMVTASPSLLLVLGVDSADFSTWPFGVYSELSSGAAAYVLRGVTSLDPILRPSGVCIVAPVWCNWTLCTSKSEHRALSVVMGNPSPEAS
jgi:hypothetical protein